MKVLAIVSGGMDSVTLAHDLHHDGDLRGIISFDYGQRHSTELQWARGAAHDLSVPWDLVDLTKLHLGGSALTDPKVEVPDGHYAEETMKATVVPNRNAIMLSIATGYAVAQQCDAVAIAVHGGDHFIYPDCRPEFIQAMNKAMGLATAGFAPEGFHIIAPYLMLTKADIVKRGDVRGVPFGRTWSCYKGGATHCGACGTCFERREAFVIAGVNDPTEYKATPDYAIPPGL